ncbi:TasA family protein [Paraclostridium bifermentans]|uniref:TasA family protein n=1 Tax=Paraclostridium bifermentans TaxID=1490 RepID=UPI000408A176|nr:TasA family protein [Paraclostridium bifermentans]
MSRLKSLKEKIRKKTIKTTMASLALALAIGSTQIMGTYALFKDTVAVTDNLTISTGDVDVEISEGFNETDIKSGDTFTKKINITNNGTLEQNVGIALDSSLTWISFKIDFISEQFRDIENLSVDPQSVNNTNGELIILGPNKSIEANIIVKVGTVPKDAENTTRSFNIVTFASQVNNDNSGVNNGFYDKCIQKNTIQFGEENIITSEDKQIKIAGLGQNSNQYLEISYIAGDFPKPDDGISFVSGTGKFKEASVVAKSNNTFEIHGVHVYDKNTQNYLFESNYGTDTMTIKFNYKNKPSKLVHFDFKSVENVHGNRAAIARYTITEEINKQSELEVVELPKEEVVEPNEPVVVEPPKEEVEKPNQPEIIEPPKEEVVVPGKPDIIEPSKEEIEIQE